MVPARPLACLAVVIALAGPAAAQPAGSPPSSPPAASGTPEERRAKAKTIAEDAGRKYNLGQFDSALKLYTEAYDTFPAAGLLFNLAQCHRSLGNHERAVFFYEGYMREKPTAANRDLVEELLAEERALLTKQREAEAEKARLAAEQKRAADEEDRRRAEEQRLADEQRRREEEERRRTGLLAPTGGGAAAGDRDGGSSVFHRWWFWTAIGVGVAAATVGTLVYVNAQDDGGLPSGSLGTLDDRN